MAPENPAVNPIDIRECQWFHPLNIALINAPLDNAQRRLMESAINHLRKQQHHVVEDPHGVNGDDKFNVMFSFAEIPDGPGFLIDRIPENDPPFGIGLMQEFGLKKRPENLFTHEPVPSARDGSGFRTLEPCLG